jgi:basic membrane protein A
VTYVVFDDNETSYLAGAAAALKTKTGTIGFVGGVDLDIIWRFQAGFEAGARAVDPNIKILSTYLSEPPDYSGFQSQPAGYQAADGMYKNGADVVFVAAGLGGYGGFQAAADESNATGVQRWAIGADSDQYQNVTLLPGVVDAGAWQQHILTSVVKRWDRAIEDVLGKHANGTLAPGVTSLDLGSGGIDLSYSGGFLDDVKPRLESLRSQIVSHRIAVPCVPPEKVDQATAQGVTLSCRR